MKALTPQQVLAQFACRLRNADPKSWEQFIECFDAYTTEVTVAVTRADANEILNLQGRAQAFLSLLDTFRNCQHHANPKE
jgi:hypothetical protein